jgi:hypothetical protein
MPCDQFGQASLAPQPRHPHPRVRGVPRAAGVGSAVEARGSLDRRRRGPVPTDQAGAVRTERRRGSEHASRDADQPPAARAIRSIRWGARPTWSWWKAAVAALATSLVLEVVQHLISTGSFDTTDLIVNTAGALIGWAIFVVVRRVSGEHASVVMTRICVIVSALALAAAVAFVASPLNYGPQRDVVEHRTPTQ